MSLLSNYFQYTTFLKRLGFKVTDDPVYGTMYSAYNDMLEVWIWKAVFTKDEPDKIGVDTLTISLRKSGKRTTIVDGYIISDCNDIAMLLDRLRIVDAEFPCLLPALKALRIGAHKHDIFNTTIGHRQYQNHS